ncbi:hypothetical protein AWM68_17475 [Fictibacillus phosphorivorans]|uniref:Uncharacterized protein n=1 Tax=Fictibacillus phosphorivorans TaxID=1221500 RepID=A0A165NWK3_9BACL|nr:hypothetical protein [Fictibacillus phosphorivorans]KZE67963.1 hypothetical protein AWM68_17475 [Fictibacillus phosphorivorans]
MKKSWFQTHRENYKKRSEERYLEKQSEKLTKQLNMSSYQIINGQIKQIKADFLNGASEITSQAAYIKSVPICTAEALIDILKDLSYNVKSIFINFCEFKDGVSMETILYLNQEIPIKLTVCEIIYNNPCEIRISAAYKEALQLAIESY